MINDPKILGLALLGGLIPSLIWLWFWLKEDTHPESAKMITLSFLGGMLAVLFVLPLQKLVYTHWSDHQALSFSLWASMEEIAKFVLVYFIALRNKAMADEPVDDIIYLIIAALGFVTLENTLFLIEPIHIGNFSDSIVHGNLRFIGASLLHIMSSATIGICMGLSFYKSKRERVIWTLSGIVLAIVLHTAFNLFIINSEIENIFFIFGVVWFGVVLLLLLFERVKHVHNTIKVNN